MVGFFLLLPLGVVVGVGTPIAAAWWIMGPIDEAAKDRRHPAQFSLADFLCLFFLLQLSMGLVHWAFAGDAGTNAVWLLDAYAWISLTSLWWAGVRRLSRAGIRNPWIRCAFLTVAIPFAPAVMVVLPIGAIMVVVGGGVVLTGRGPGVDFVPFIIAGLAAASAAGVAYALGLSTRWMLRRYGAAAEPSTPALAELVPVSLDPAAESEADHRD